MAKCANFSLKRTLLSKQVSATRTFIGLTIYENETREKIKERKDVDGMHRSRYIWPMEFSTLQEDTTRFF